MTAYNEERFLKAALESLLNQTFQDFEIIVVNDGSTDRTGEILDHLAQQDARIRSAHQSNMGRVRSLNQAVALASGDFLAVMDSDDIALPNRLEAGLHYLKAHPEFGLVASFFEQIDVRDAVIKRVDQLPTETNQLATLLPQDNPICHGTIMLPKNVMEQVGGYREAFLAALDYDLYLRILDHYPIGMIPEVLYRYRVHGSSISARRLLQLQMKSLAQAMYQERQKKGQDTLQALSGEAQAAFVADFLAEDRRLQRKRYSQILLEQGRKYYRLGETDAALQILKIAFALDCTRLKTVRYLGKAFVRKLLPSN